MSRLIKNFFFILFFCASTALFSQENDSNELRMQDITVTTFRNERASRSALNIALLNADSLSGFGNFNVTDLMAKIPGVSMMTTGIGIAKPVIRGAYGNRVLILLNGLKFDNQQWQEEHGLGLSDIGIGKVEIVKGPMSVLFGTEALGGIINLIEEDKPKTGEKQWDALWRINTNNLGNVLQFGYKKNTGKRWTRLRVGAENHADYTDGNGQRVLNSRYDGYYLKYSLGFRRGRWVSENNFSSSFNRFGFIFSDIYSFVSPDARWSRKLDVNPAHLVLLNVFASENKFSLRDKSRLNVNVGLQSNERMENEGGGQISLNMHLLTFQYLAKWDKQISKRSNLIVSNLGSLQDNMNFGARKIVPDARMQESNLAVYLENRLNAFVTLENGIGYGVKRIRTFFTPGVNNPGREIGVFTKSSGYYNIFSGVSVMTRKFWNLKLNVATGVRVPNLAELSSNGIHEGVFTYEIGNPKFKNEQVFSGNMYISKIRKNADFYISPFYNFYINYVYLAPTNEQWFGLPVNRFFQQNARQYGSEVYGAINIKTHWKVSLGLSGMVSKTADGKYTPYIPAFKGNPMVQYSFAGKKQRTGRVYASANFLARQAFTAPAEIGSKSYALLDAGCTFGIPGKKYQFDITLAGTNLLNQAYYDNLSRFKYFGLLNPGRNFAITLKVKQTSGIGHR